MREFFALLGVMLKSGAGLGNLSRGNVKRKKRAKRTSNLFVYLFMLLIFTASFGMSYYGLGLAGKEAGVSNQEIAIMLASNSATITFFFSICFSFVFIISNYFMATDDPFYLHLPLKTTSIWLAKFASSFVITFMMTFGTSLAYMIVCPIVLGEFPPLLIVNTLLVYLGIVFLIFGVAFLVGLFLTTVCRLNKHKEVLTVISGLIGVLTGLSIGFLVGFSGDSGVPQFFQQVLYYPIRALSADGAESFLWSLAIFGIGLVSSLIALFIAKFVYLKSIAGASDQHKSKRLSSQKLETKVDKGTQGGRYSYPLYLKRELRTVLRSGSLFFNTLFPTILFTIVSVVSICFFYQMGIPEHIAYGIFLLLVTVTPNFVNYGSACSYSRDSYSMLQIASTPIDQRTLLRAKVTPGVSLVAISTLAITISAGLSLQISPLFATVGYLAGLLLAIGSNYILAWIDLRKGTYTQTNELYISKNSKSVLLGSLTCFLLLIPVGVFGIVLIAVDVSPWLMMGLTGLVCLLIASLLIPIEQGIERSVRYFTNS